MNPTSTRLKAAAVLAASLAAGAFAAPAVAGTMQTSSHDFIHKQMGDTTPEARSVGLITGGYGVGKGSSGIVNGSGVLVGGRYVLTAAHLVDDMNNSARFHFNGQTYGMSRWVVHRDFYQIDVETWNPTTRVYGNGNDLALIQLDRRVVGARNLKATLSRSRHERGKTATIVGMGQGGNGFGGVGYGIGGNQISSPITDTDGGLNNGDTSVGGPWGYRAVKRAGKNTVEPLGPYAGDPRISNGELVTDFDADPSFYDDLRRGLGEESVGAIEVPNYDPFTGTYNVEEDDIPITSEFAPSTGDSGGGLFINGKLAGITSWSTRRNSEFFSQAHYSRLSTGGRYWVQANIQAFNWSNKFRKVLRIRDEENVLTPNNPDDLHRVTNIFGPNLFRMPDDGLLDVGETFGGGVVFNDLGADPGPLSHLVYPSSVPEPASLALLGLGGFAMLRRSRR